MVSNRSSKKKTRRPKSSRKLVERTRKVAKGKPTVPLPKKVLQKAPASRPPARPEPQPVKAESLREGTGFKIAVDRIEGETIIGDMMVVFPRTREVLKKHGLNLDVEDAGDIYMSLEAFAALRGLEMEALMVELEVASRELPPQLPITPVITAPAP